MFGAPPNWITLPFSPISCASPPTPPTAAADARQLFTFDSNDSSNAARFDAGVARDVER